MVREFKGTMDFVDAIEDVKHKISFMSDACMALLGREEACVSQDSISGLYEIFRGVEGELDALEDAIRENVYEVVESVTTKDAASENRNTGDPAPPPGKVTLSWNR